MNIFYHCNASLNTFWTHRIINEHSFNVRWNCLTPSSIDRSHHRYFGLVIGSVVKALVSTEYIIMVCEHNYQASCLIFHFHEDLLNYCFRPHNWPGCQASSLALLSVFWCRFWDGCSSLLDLTQFPEDKLNRIDFTANEAVGFGHN